MKTIIGNLFIVPNRASSIDNWMAKSTRTSMRRSLANVGLQPSDEPLVQVWYISDDCENWGSAKWDENPEFFGSWGIPTYLPASVLKGVKEGDEITLHWTGDGDRRELRLTAAQNDFRYKRFGSFEEVLEMVTGS